MKKLLFITTLVYFFFLITPSYAKIIILDGQHYSVSSPTTYAKTGDTIRFALTSNHPVRFNNMPSGANPFEDGKDYILSIAGDYSFNCTNPYCGSHPMGGRLIVEDVNAVINAPDKFTAKVFPNPVENLLNVTGNNFNNHRINIKNNLGYLVSSFLMAPASLQSIDVTSLPCGYYFIELIDEINSASKVFKVMKK